uniref:Chlorophyll a-b binding protein, chloroplastic n=1 Tax=Cajanus cajan TaxID=3821 RepID=A0A151SGA6_CAJCA|nr:hypothetical protein KK1_024397 [Cajanus cajan]
MATATAATSSFMGARLVEAQSGSGRVQARFGFGSKKKAAAKKVSKGSDRPLWYPGAKAPEWLDGSLVGDYGFDPFGLGKPAEYLQECELIHGRWAMLATLGALTVEWLTGVTWQDAGKVELVEGSSYLGQPLPFSITTLIWIEVLVIGYIEFQRNAELDPEKRLYPGGSYFDPLGLASDPEKKATLQLAEIKHARLAMVGFLGFAVQAAATGKGPLNNWATHLSDPLHTTIIDTFSSSS